MSRIKNPPSVIALVATMLLTFDATASEKPLPFITIAGDFVWDRGDVRYALTEEIRKPVTVQWRAGMRVSDALLEAGVRPLHDHAELKIHSGETYTHVGFQSIQRDNRGDIILKPGATISFRALEF